MKNNILEYIILYVMVACAALVIATLARIVATSMGLDGFTAFMAFIIVLAIQAVVYLSIHVVLQNLMLPWIGKGLAKVPYFRNKIAKRQGSVIENENESNVPEQPSLEDLRNKLQRNIAKDQESKLNIAWDYTRKSFALYLSDKDIEVLCRNVQIYVDKLDAKELNPVKIKELSINDLRHFGWNVWNHLTEKEVGKKRDQIDIAYFLKTVFPDIFKDSDVKTIKSHLKDDELKGVIKIQESLSE